MSEKNNLDTTLNQFFYDGNVCPHCKKGIKIHYVNSKYYGCPNCSSYLDIREPAKIKKINSSSKRIPPSLPIGTKGKIDEVTYEVIGYTHCREAQSIYTWNEYYLYNKNAGFVFLSEHNGHWILLTEPSIHPKINFNDKLLIHEEREYRLYSVYRSEVRYSEGEFDSDIIASSNRVINEYIHPPYMLACEHVGKDIYGWFQGESLSKAELKKIVADQKITLPDQSGVGMIQPFSKSYKMPTLWKVALAGIAALLLIHIITSACKDSNKVVFDQTYTLADTSVSFAAVVTNPFTLNKGLTDMDNISVELSCPVDNTWMEAQVNLVNDDTGEEFSFENGVEYYHGYTEGENWSEGGTSNEITLSNIPAGSYHMNIFPIQESFTSKRLPYFQVKVRRGNEMWSNFLIIAFFILAFPLIQYLRYRTMEKTRWSNSDYGD